MYTQSGRFVGGAMYTHTHRTNSSSLLDNTTHAVLDSVTRKMETRACAGYHCSQCLYRRSCIRAQRKLRARKSHTSATTTHVYADNDERKRSAMCAATATVGIAARITSRAHLLVFSCAISDSICAWWLPTMLLPLPYDGFCCAACCALSRLLR